jgi:SAM-dependent methyltransferase
MGKVTIPACDCTICGYKAVSPRPEDLGKVRGNTERFKSTLFQLWKCPRCNTIHSLDPVDFQDIYRDYPLNKRRLDIYARLTLGHLLKRLQLAGLKKTDRIIDYGCGNGVFVKFLKEKGYERVTGYDPYVAEFAHLQENGAFDCVVANDVIEHVSDPRALIRDCVRLVTSGGLLYIGTADSEGVEMNNLEPHVMRLHQPFHRIIVSQETLKALGRETGLELVGSYRRSYMDTLVPFANYRFLDEFSKALGHDMNRALDTAAGLIVLRKPGLFFYGFLGYFFPSAYEPAIVLRKGG